MQIYAGTSGFSYKEWKGSFYPEDLPARRMLEYYAGQLPAVEINNTFYRMPKTETLESWAEQVPDAFRFAIKASRRITHQKRLKDAGDETDYLLRTLRSLGKRLGVLLFQLPPYQRKDLPRLSEFLELLPERAPVAFEFRHASWYEDDVIEALRARDFALCIADTDELAGELITTADWGYLRLRRSAYSDKQLGEWARRIKSQDWNTAYVFFKHEDEGAGPKMAARFLELG